MLIEHIPAATVLFFVLYGITGAVPFVAALYLLLRRGNAFAPGVSPPVRLRRWAAAYFAVSSLSHVWWLLLYIYSLDIHTVAYVVVVLFDCMMLLTTIAGTLLAMLQDRRRPLWPVLVALTPFVVLGGIYMAYPVYLVRMAAIAYILLLFLLFTVYMVFSVRRYGRWLRDNYADLENKKVWLIQTVTLGFMLMFILYASVTNIVSAYLMHTNDLVLFVLLLWRVETLPTLQDQPLQVHPQPLHAHPQPLAEGRGADGSSAEEAEDVAASAGVDATEEKSVCPPHSQGEAGSGAYVDLALIERLLAEHCVATKLYLQHDLTLHQLAQAIGTNRTYLSLYFSRQGITYNTYINNLRINHFISRCQEAAAAGQPILAQQLASDSGYRSYSTFSLAFKQRTGQSVTAWMRDTEE